MTPEPDVRETARLLQAGVQAAQRGDKAQARQLLFQVTEQDPTQETAWLWLAGVAETPQDALAYLETALTLNPQNERAQEGLRWLQAQLSPVPSGVPCPRCGNLVPAEGTPCPTCGHAPTETMETTAIDETLSDMPSSGFVLSVEQAEAIDEQLERIAYESEARCIILADMTGRLISERGQTHEINTQVLSAVAAGELAATNELARLVGEEARFKLLLHEGVRRSVYLSDVGEQMLLVIVFDKDTPIGLVRIILKQAVEELEPILAEAQRTDGSAQAVGETLGGDFAQLLESELDASLGV